MGSDWVRAYTSIESSAASHLAERLRDRLGKETDPDTEGALIDAAASLATDPGPRPTEEQLPELRLALASVANPLRDPSESPAWKRLEDISGKRFDHDIDGLLDWLKSCCQLTASDARQAMRVKISHEGVAGVLRAAAKLAIASLTVTVRGQESTSAPNSSVLKLPRFGPGP